MSSYRLLAYCDKYRIDLLFLERCREFSLYLTNVISEKYLGEEFIDNMDIVNNHFDFWWDKTCEKFSIHTSIDLKDNEKGKVYLKKMIIRIFYISTLKIETRINILRSTINTLFDFSKYEDKDFDVILSLSNIFKNGKIKNINE